MTGDGLDVLMVSFVPRIAYRIRGIAIQTHLCHLWCLRPRIAGIKSRKAMPSRLLIVDDHEIVCMGVRTLFANNDSFMVCGEVQNGVAAIRVVPCPTGLSL